MRREGIGDKHRVHAQLVGQLYNQAPIGILATLVNSAIVVFILWHLISRDLLLLWVGASALVAALRYGLVQAHRTAAFKQLRPRSWEMLQVGGIGVSGMLWGCAGLFLFPTQSTAHQVFLAFVLAGMVAGAVGVCSSVFGAFVVFSVPALAPIMVRFLLTGDKMHTAMGAMTLLFLVLTSFTARRINVSATELVALKEHFADKVEERTSELMRANQELNREIGERKQAEKNLRESERRIRMVIDHAQVVLWALDGSGTFTLSEGRGLAALGLEPGQVVGRRVFDVYSDYPQIMEDAREALKGKSVSSVAEVSGIIFESRYVPLTDERGAVSGAIGVAIDITARERAEAGIRSALREKEVLLKEVHHRVKNNLAVISGILKMQSARVADPQGKEALRDCYDRVKAIALIHETLYHSKDLAAIPLEPYARNLSNNLMQMMLSAEARPGMRVVIEADGIELPVDEAVPCGLILNELVTNAFKYAFPNQAGGQILISARISDGGLLELVVRDNGVGLPAHLDPDNPRTLGFRIISMLVTHQMEGTWEAGNENGARIALRWPTATRKGFQDGAKA